MERLTIPDEKIEGGVKRTVIDSREVKKNAMTIYWALKKYEDTGLTPIEIIRKHMNDKAEDGGWIPVEDRLPKVAGDIDDDNCPEFNVTIDGADKATTLKCSSDGTFFDDNGYVYPVIAWRPLPEPYRPERSAK